MLEAIDRDIKAAMRKRDSETVSTLRMIKSALESTRIENKGELSEEDAVATLRKQAKQRRESIDSYRSAGREEQAVSEEAELAVIERYLPEEMDDAELEKLVDEAIEETGAESMKDMGAIMRVLQPRVAGRAEGGAIADLVRKKLQ